MWKLKNERKITQKKLPGLKRAKGNTIARILFICCHKTLFRAAGHLINEIGCVCKIMTKLHHFSRKKKEKKNLKAIVWAVCFVFRVVCYLVFLVQSGDNVGDASKRLEKRVRVAAPEYGRCDVCILYSFINYTDFKAALFYNAGLL